MHKNIVFVLIMATCHLAISQDNTTKSDRKIERENIEWCDIWVPSAPNGDKPRVLLIGDSILKGYYETTTTHLKGQAYCARLATSYCVADPAFHDQLETMLTQYEYSVIHFNNGLHGMGYTEEAYEKGFEKAIKLIKKKSKAKVVLVLSTPLRSTSDKDHLNPRIDERNNIVRRLAKKYGASVNNLHSISKGLPEYYKDPYHFNTEAIALQGKQVADTIEGLIRAK